MLAISATSSFAYAITGDAPNANKPFAVKFVTTTFVILCTSGLDSLTKSTTLLISFIFILFIS